MAIDLEKGFFFDVLQSLDTLEELEFEHLSVSDKDEKQCCMIPSRLDTVKIYRLKSLIIHICASGTVAAMINCNDLFESILKACPNLEEFKMTGSIIAAGTLTLNCKQHAKLNDIGINFFCIHYPGKPWKYLGECMVDVRIVKTY